MMPLVSEELEASNETTNGAEPEFGKTEKLATGGEFKSEQAVTKDRIRTTRGAAAASFPLGDIAIIALESYIHLRCQARSDLFCGLRHFHPRVRRRDLYSGGQIN